MLLRSGDSDSSIILRHLGPLANIDREPELVMMSP